MAWCAMVKHWSNTGQIRGRRHSATAPGARHAPAWRRRRAALAGRGARAHWSSTGQALVKHWSNTGQTLVKHWSNTGQAQVLARAAQGSWRSRGEMGNRTGPIGRHGAQSSVGLYYIILYYIIYYYILYSILYMRPVFWPPGRTEQRQGRRGRARLEAQGGRQGGRAGWRAGWAGYATLHYDI